MKHIDIELCRLEEGVHFGEIPFFSVEVLEEELGLEACRNSTMTDSSMIDKYNHDKRLRIYAAKRSAICAVCHTYCIFYYLTYSEFKPIVSLDPRIYRLFKSIALERKKQIEEYSDRRLRDVVYQNIVEESQVHQQINVDDHLLQHKTTISLQLEA